MRNAALLALAAAALLLFLYGCTGGGVNYQQCCVRDRIYGVSATPPVLQANPTCYFPDGTLFGECNPATTGSMRGTAECTSKLCGQIAVEGECKKTTTCKWDLGSCKPVSGTDDRAFFLLPVCTDAYPRNCTSGLCQAMVCGYVAPVIGPAPTSNDYRPCDQI